MSAPRRIACPFVDQFNHDIVNAFFFDCEVNVVGKLEAPPVVVAVQASAADILGGKDVQSGIWRLKEFQSRFKIA